MFMNSASHYLITQVGKVRTIDKEPFISGTRAQVIDQVTEAHTQRMTSCGQLIGITRRNSGIGYIAI